MWRAEGHAPQATICIDPFHAVKLVTDALDTVRRATWNELRRLPDQAAAKKFKGARWALLKRRENLTEDQSTTLRQLRRRGGDLWRAYSLKEAFRGIFAGDLDPDQTTELIDRWCSKASRSRLPSLVKVAKTIRKFRDGILAAIRHDFRPLAIVILSGISTLRDRQAGSCRPGRDATRLVQMAKR